MNLEQLLKLSVKVAKAHESLTELRAELEQISDVSGNQLRMVDNCLQALDTLAGTLRETPG